MSHRSVNKDPRSSAKKSDKSSQSSPKRLSKSSQSSSSTQKSGSEPSSPRSGSRVVHLPPDLLSFLNELVNEHSEQIVKLGMSYAEGSSPKEREDKGLELVSEVWLEAYGTLARGLARGEPLPEKPDSWLRRLAWNVVMEDLRRRYRDRERRSDDLDLDVRESPEEGIEDQVLKRMDLRKAWEHLNDRQKLAIYRFWPEEVEKVFPEEAGKLSRQSSELKWSQGAKHKALYDARRSAKKPREA